MKMYNRKYTFYRTVTVRHKQIE